MTDPRAELAKSQADAECEREALRQYIAENKRLREALEAIRDYPPEGHERRTEDGYPAEIAYDEFAYRRLVDSYRDAATEALEGEDD